MLSLCYEIGYLWCSRQESKCFHFQRIPNFCFTLIQKKTLRVNKDSFINFKATKYMYSWDRYLGGRNPTILKFHFQAVIINLPFVICLFIQFIARHTTATLVISLCVLLTAANSVFMLVHLHADTLTVTLASKFPSTPTLVALNALLSSRRHFLAKRLV